MEDAVKANELLPRLVVRGVVTPVTPSPCDLRGPSNSRELAYPRCELSVPERL